MSACRTGRALGRTFTTTGYSSFASTSLVTLDAPPFDQLYPRAAEPAAARQTRGRRARRRTASLELALSAFAPSDQSTRRPPPPPPPRPRADPTQVSPYLPLVTREKNYLLSQFRQSLDSRPRAPSPRTLRARTAATGPTVDDTWTHFVRVLRYPAEEVPVLPRSHFPSSTRRPSALVKAPQPDTFDPSFPLEPPAASRAIDRDGGDRGGIELSLAELHQTFAVFARHRPRTRTGLHRLLVVVELIARHSKQPSRPGHVVDEGADADGRLKRGGLGLTDREWRQLILFVGTNLRSTRPDPDTKHVLSLFTQREELRARSPAGGGRKKRKRAPALLPTEETRTYNALLHVAQRSRMWELFDQVLDRMRDRGVREDVASHAARLVREDPRAVLSNGGGGGGGQGKRARKQGRRVLTNAVVWILAKRGHLDEADKIYRAMREGKTVDLNLLEPATVPTTTEHATPPSDRPPLQVRLPSPDDRLYSSLVQAYTHHGQLRSALVTMYEMIHAGSFPASPVHFHHLFRSFVRFGEVSATMDGAGPDGPRTLDWVSLSGLKADTTRAVSSPTTSPLSILSVSSPSRSSAGRRRSRANEAEEATTEFTLSALSTIFESFLSLSPPSSARSTTSPVDRPRPRLGFEGQRTAPSAQTVFFVLKSFERLLSPAIPAGQEETLLHVWNEMEHKFTNAATHKGKWNRGETGWTGWKMDKRVTKMVQGYKNAVLEREARLNELR
ncbi:hypothetical protein JCM11491_000192 [Sporobolomyces phaffii]